MPDLGNVLQTLPGFLAIINIVILMSAVFFFTSTVASHLLEVWTGWRNSRGTQLRARLEAALGKPAADAIYNDPLVQSISTFKGTITSAGRDGTFHPPSYIEPEIFARVVKTLSEPNGKLLIDSTAREVITRVRAAAAGVEAQVEPKIMEWFKSINDHQNGVYTRWTFLRLLMIGFLFASVMDIDTIHIAGNLWSDPERANKIVTELEKKVQANSSRDQSSLSEVEKKKIADENQQNKEAIASAMSQIRNAAQPAYAWQKPIWMYQASEAPGKFLGWLLTALATSLGAQFWFNIMSEALKLRATGRKPDEDAKSGRGAPVQAANQPAANPPAGNPPAANQPAANQPAANPPAGNPPAGNQPAANPPAGNPPASNR